MMAPSTYPDEESTVQHGPRLPGRFRQRFLERGHGEDVVIGHVGRCRRFILFHRKCHPREIGVAEVGQFLAHVAKGEGEPLRAIAAAHCALEFLYGDVPGINLGELPRPKPPKLLDQVRHLARLRHYARRTEDCYVAWIERYIRYHGLRHPREPGAAGVAAFLTHLAAEAHVTASKQNQALNALVFLYQHVLETELGRVDAMPTASFNSCPAYSTVVVQKVGYKQL